ncbi:Clp protease N-terminal domain-containing protein [Streptomyces tsukubensis]|uniref:Clp protease N-terminal domain-containing protein n=1 Tax=Streptomyces tsukubensis TaxID=83656 RepID=UPI0036AFE833
MAQPQPQAQVDIGWKVIGILGAAWGATDTNAIGSEHLLAAITDTKCPARDALAAEGVTRTGVLAILRDRQGRPDAVPWAGDDDFAHSVSSRSVLGDDGDERRLLTGNARRAFEAALQLAEAEARGEKTGIARLRPEHLLRGLLREEETRCAELLAVCGTTAAAVLARLDGEQPSAGGDGAGSPGTGVPESLLDPLLHRTRDLLLGNRHYPMAFWKRWLVSGVNWATQPGFWVVRETPEQARELGHRRLGTEHILLAVLATHEVAMAHPHLAQEGLSGTGARFRGGERLAAMGLDYAGVRRALASAPDLGTDPTPVEEILTAARADDGTGPLVETLLQDGTRAGRLIRQIRGADPRQPTTAA